MQEKIWSKINAESTALWNLDRENGDFYHIETQEKVAKFEDGEFKMIE